MTFSGALTITDLDDFLNPSQACIIPVRQTNKVAGQENGENSSTDIHIDSDNNYYEVSTYPTSAAGPSSGSAKANGQKALEKAEINLNDCLACSGCITSTESMLITMQSHLEVIDFIAAQNGANPSSPEETPKRRTPILSISPQSLASLSASYSASSGHPPIPLKTLLRRIRSFLSRPERGGWRVWDTTFSRHIALRESVIEFTERKKGKERANTLNPPTVPPPGPLPMLASACPGWVCYAEKAQAEMLPLLTSTRSPQAIMGGLVKQWWAGQMGLSSEEVYHVTAMPCYDKKLEASRSDFYSAVNQTRDVDCVLTTGELDLLLSDLGFQPHNFVPGENEPISRSNDLNDPLGSPWPELIQHPGTSSGSYLHSIIHFITTTHPNPTHLTIRENRGSADNVDYILTDNLTGEVLFKGAKCYGFRNLQNLVRKVGRETGLVKSGGRGGASKLSAAIAARKKGVRARASNMGNGGGDTDVKEEGIVGEDKKLDFVEVMACPGGCVNGGGQMKPVTRSLSQLHESTRKGLDEQGYERPLADEGVDEGMRWSTKEWVGKVESIYWGLPTPPASPPLSPGSIRDGAGGQVKKSGGVDGVNADVDMVNGSGNGMEKGNGNEGKDEVNGNGNAVEVEADRMAEQVVRDVCADDPVARWEFLRTRFRKVEGDVLGGGVSHEAVKW